MRRLLHTVRVVGEAVEPPPPPPPPPPSGLDDTPVSMFATFNGRTTPRPFMGEVPAVSQRIWLNKPEYMTFDSISGKALEWWDTKMEVTAKLAAGFESGAIIYPSGQVGEGFYIDGDDLAPLSAEGWFFCVCSGQNMPVGQLIDAAYFVNKSNGLVEHALGPLRIADALDATRPSRVGSYFTSFNPVSDADIAKPFWRYLCFDNCGQAAAGTYATSLFSKKHIQEGRDLRTTVEDWAGTIYQPGTRFDVHLAVGPNRPGLSGPGAMPIIDGRGTIAIIAGIGRPDAFQNQVFGDWLERPGVAGALRVTNPIKRDSGDSFRQPFDTMLSLPASFSGPTAKMTVQNVARAAWDMSRYLIPRDKTCGLWDMDYSAREYCIFDSWEVLNEVGYGSLAVLTAICEEYVVGLYEPVIPEVARRRLVTHTIPGTTSTDTTSIVGQYNDWLLNSGMAAWGARGLRAVGDLVGTDPCLPENFIDKNPVHWKLFEIATGIYVTQRYALVQAGGPGGSFQQPGNFGTGELDAPPSGNSIPIRLNPASGFFLTGGACGVAGKRDKFWLPGGSGFQYSTAADILVGVGIGAGKVLIPTVEAILPADAALAAGSVVQGTQTHFLDGHPTQTGPGNAQDTHFKPVYQATTTIALAA